MGRGLRSAIPLLIALPLWAEGPNYVQWSLTLQPTAAPPGSKVLARLEGKIDAGWHVYSMSTAAAIPTTIELAPNPAVAKFRVFQSPFHKAYDANFQSDTETYENSAVFLIELQLASSAPPGA